MNLHRATTVVSPFGNGVDNSNVMVIGVSTTAGAAQIPDEWLGGSVTLKMLDADVYWFFQESTAAPTGTALPDASVGAAPPATGTRDKQLGWRLRDGEVAPEQVPAREDPTKHIWLCHDGSGAGVLWVHLASPSAVKTPGSP